MRESDRQAAAEIMPLVYDELKKLAAYRMAKESQEHTLQATALVHEAYLRLTKTGTDPRWENRGHFFSAAAEAMRRIMIDRARHRKRTKHGGDLERTSFQDKTDEDSPGDDELLALDEVLDEFSKAEPEIANVVKMRYFAGFSLPEIAKATDVSLRTVNRQWAYASAWLRRAMTKNR